ncbi:MAG TPA: tRNA pseudouridine(38-40) synthase TruA [Gammaproteobacteria bacterium]|nr:tRNA pseudouridine(38-40) synthase TruA [Gammaproteobacteria bacterium]
MERIVLGISYNGAPYHGWQFQSDAIPTVQGTLESALSSIANSTVRVTCAGRTDTGVHATHQVVNFGTNAERDINAWINGTNSQLPESVSVTHAAPVPESFNARHSATARRYLYVIYNTRVRSALLPEYMTREHRGLDAERMHQAAQALIGENDFTSYRAANCQSSTPMRNVMSVEIWRHGDLVLVDITANAFLLHMVRNIAGVLLDVGAGEKPVSWVGDLLALRDRSKGSKTAPPNGLFLIGVTYEIDIGIPGLVWPHFLSARP